LDRAEPVTERSLYLMGVMLMSNRQFKKLFIDLLFLSFAAFLHAQEQGLVRLTNDSATDLYPAWSPDNKSIVFVSYPGGTNPDIWEVSPTGTNLQQLTTEPHLFGGLTVPAWLGSTGDLVLLNNNDFWNWLRFTLSANPALPVNRPVYDGNSPDFEELLFVPGGLAGAWFVASPDGTTAAWDALTTSPGQCPGHTDLHIAPVTALAGQDNTTEGNIIASTNLNCSLPNPEGMMGISFSPDGSQVVVAIAPDPNYYAFDLYVYNLDGTLVRKLTSSGVGPNKTINWQPSWSSDNRIAFSSNSTGRLEIWTINSDGSSLTQATTNGGNFPSWSPDASRIAFASFRDGASQIYSISIGGAAVIPGSPLPPMNSAGQSLIGPSQSATSAEGQTAEPVSTGSGNYFYSHADFVIPARGLPLTFNRYYNSIDAFAGSLGANWSHAYSISLGQTAAGVATIRWGDGHGETYTLTGSTYIPQSGVYNSLVANTDGTFTLTQKNQTQYHFSSTGKLAFIEDKNGNTVQLTYDGSGNLTSIAASGGRTLSLLYDTNGRVTTVTDPMGRTETFSYDSANNLATATDPLGGITTYGYDANHRVVQITLPNGNTLLQNTYDTQGRVVAQANGRSFTWQFAYNTPSQGQTTITDALGNVTIHTYDSSLRIVGITDAAGHTTSYTYDASNNRTSITNQNGNTTSFAYDPNGNLLSVTDPLSNQTTFTYDAENDLLTVTNPKGKTTNFSYDSDSNLTAIQDALGNKTALVYDSNGELISKTDARGNTTKFQYSSLGNLTGITDALGKSTSLGYDGDGRLVSLTDPSLHTATSAYDALGRLTLVSDALGDKTQFSYDTVGNLLSVTDANGHTAGYSYDATNNLISVKDALGHVTKYAYDADNNRVGFTNAKGNSTSYQFDLLNRLIRSVDPLGFATTYSYDAVGNVAAVTDAKSQTNKFAYDALNRLLSVAYADKNNVTYVYDADGNRTSMIDWTGTTSYAYDALDRLTSVGFPGNKTVAYSYDVNGRRATLTYPGGKSVSFGYDPDERLAMVTDWLSHATTYSYNSVGNLTNVQYPNSARIAFSYDPANRLTSVVNTTVGVPPLAFNYALDPVGNRTKVTEAGIPTVYGYDALNQLTSAQTWPFKTSWTYDAVGNRLSEASPFGTTKYSYDASDRLITAGTRTFTYDADGNESSVADTFAHIKRSYAFNAANRLVSVDGGLTSSFVYDGDGNRISQSAGSLKQNYVNDIAAGLPVVLQDAIGGGPTSSYVYGLNLIEAFQPLSNDFYHYDGLGSVILLTDIKGRPETGYLYDAWGNSILPASPTNPFRFTGQALDSATGLYYLRARYYDPSVGGFLNKDPLPGFIAQPKDRNRYRYSLGNPIRFTDPSGLSAIESTNQTASILSVCGVNCTNILSAAFDAVTSAADVTAQILLEGWNAATSITAVDAGNTGLQTVSAVIVNPDTVSAVTNTILSQPDLIRSASGYLGPNYSKADLDISYGLVCADSYAAGLCLGGEQYVEGLIMKAAAQQGDMPGFQ
jgi:RHS repeat-associated protein